MNVILSKNNSPSFNLAAEEFLFTQRKDDILFLYVNAPSVVIGSNQAIANEVDLEFCKENGIAVVRRMSGGGAVFHDSGNVNYCFISSKRDGKSSLDGDFLLPIVEVLSLHNIPVEIGSRKDLWLEGGFKISGTASHISKGRELHHGTLLYDANLQLLQNALSPKHTSSSVKAIASVRSQVMNIRHYLECKGQKAMDANVFFKQIAESLMVYCGQTTMSVLNDAEIGAISKIEEQRYAHKDWIFRK